MSLTLAQLQSVVENIVKRKNGYKNKDEVKTDLTDEQKKKISELAEKRLREGFSGRPRS